MVAIVPEYLVQKWEGVDTGVCDYCICGAYVVYTAAYVVRIVYVVMIVPRRPIDESVALPSAPR